MSSVKNVSMLSFHSRGSWSSFICSSSFTFRYRKDSWFCRHRNFLSTFPWKEARSTRCWWQQTMRGRSGRKRYSFYVKNVRWADFLFLLWQLYLWLKSGVQNCRPKGRNFGKFDFFHYSDTSKLFRTGLCKKKIFFNQHAYCIKICNFRPVLMWWKDFSRPSGNFLTRLKLFLMWTYFNIEL